MTTAIDLQLKYQKEIFGHFAGEQISEGSVQFRSAQHRERLDILRRQAKTGFSGLNQEEIDQISQEIDDLAALRKDAQNIEKLKFSQNISRDNARKENRPIFQLMNVQSEDGVSKVALQLEVPATEEQFQNGLMNRRTLGVKHGMIFSFSEEGRHPFWMHNTHVSLDMIFLDKDKKVVAILKNVPPDNDATRYPEGVASMHCVEVVAGTCDRYSIGVGDRFVASR